MKPISRGAASFLPVLFLLIMIHLAGCASIQNSGYLRPAQDATRAFESYSILPGYTYYSSGPEYYPNALIGIDGKYILESNLWKKLDLTPAGLRDLVQNMRSRALDTGNQMHGFDIVDQYGNMVGIWYSVLGVTTVVRTEDENRLILYTPPLDLYEQGFPPLKRRIR